VRTSCKHSGTVLPLVAAAAMPLLRGARPMALMLWLDRMMVMIDCAYALLCMNRSNTDWLSNQGLGLVN
jgi:hypothetical protein